MEVEVLVMQTQDPTVHLHGLVGLTQYQVKVVQMVDMAVEVQD